MRLLITSIFFVVLNSCGTTQRDGWQLASEFHANYAIEFIQNSDLLKYSYNPRSQFYFNPAIDSQTFRCWYFDSTELRILIYDNFSLFNSEFGLELDSSFSFNRATLIKKQDQLFLTINDETTKVAVRSVSKNPIDYFKSLKEDINKYGIVTYSELRIGGIIRVYLTAYDYLLYFPTNFQIDEPQFRERWSNKRKQGRKLDENWFYYRANKPLDFG